MIKLVKSTFYKEKETKKKLVNFIKKSTILSMNGECRKFEEAFAQKQGRKYAVFVSSGSSANLVLIQSLLNLNWLKKGDVIGVSSLTWPTNVMPLIQLGLKVLFLDCEIKTINVSPNILKEKIKSLDGLFLTNVLGFSDQIKIIASLCKKNNVIFLEDNCESLGSGISGNLLGNFGLAATFSFFVGHHLSTIEGGMIVTDNSDLYHMLLKVRTHGWDRDLPKEEIISVRLANNINDFFARYTFYDLAYNARPTEISGFLGNNQLPYWDEIVNKRFNNFKKFYDAQKKNDDFILLDVNHMDLISNFAMPVICKNQDCFEKYRERFEKNSVEIRPVIAGNIMEQPFYTKHKSKNDVECKNTQLIHKYGFYFGNNPELTTKEVNFLCNLLKK